MSKVKENFYENISVAEMVEELARNKTKILEDFSRAYLAEVGILPSEVELVCREMPVKDGIIEHVYVFRRKNEDRR